MTPWGCGPAELADFGNSEELRANMGCEKEVEVVYDAVKCASNVCTAVGSRVVCKE